MLLKQLQLAVCVCDDSYEKLELEYEIKDVVTESRFSEVDFLSVAQQKCTCGRFVLNCLKLLCGKKRNVNENLVNNKRECKHRTTKVALK